MSALVIWIDSHEARIFKLQEKNSEPIHLKSHGHKHHSEPFGKHATHPDAEKFFHEVAAHLGKLPDAREWLLVGPGLAHAHFKSHVEKHHSPLAQRIVGSETMDRASDAKIIEKGHLFFKARGAFEAI